LSLLAVVRSQCALTGAFEIVEGVGGVAGAVVAGIVPFFGGAYPPGGASDFQLRIVTLLAEEYLGQPVAVINRAGAGGQTGWDWFIRTPQPDGHALAAYNVPHFSAQSIVGETLCSIDNLEPIANWGRTLRC
jgi:tripartite-type tricarboxylate transporter receptor subunit TctC